MPGDHLTWAAGLVVVPSSLTNLLPFLQHPYVYIVLIFEAMATFVGQVSVLSLIALFGAATTAMVPSRARSGSLRN